MTPPISGGGLEGRIAATVAGTPAEPPTAPRGPSRSEPFSRVMERLGSEVDRGEKLVRGALSGGGRLDAGQLIALQAGIYRYSEAVDLTAKLVDRAGSAVRTTLQSGQG